MGRPGEIKRVQETFSAVDPVTGKFNPILAQIFLKEAYDIEYNIYNHDAPELSHPFQTSLYTEAKTVTKFTPLETLMEKYYHHQISKYFGMTFLEFIDLPADKADMVLDKAWEWIMREKQAAEDAKKQLENGGRQLDQMLNSNGMNNDVFNFTL